MALQVYNLTVEGGDCIRILYACHWHCELGTQQLVMFYRQLKVKCDYEDVELGNKRRRSASLSVHLIPFRQHLIYYLLFFYFIFLFFLTASSPFSSYYLNLSPASSCCLFLPLICLSPLPLNFFCLLHYVYCALPFLLTSTTATTTCTLSQVTQALTFVTCSLSPFQFISCPQNYSILLTLLHSPVFLRV